MEDDFFLIHLFIWATLPVIGSVFTQTETCLFSTLVGWSIP